MARSVGRVAFRNGRPLGTGVLIGDGLFMTNHHVVGAPEAARELLLEFDYERDMDGRLKTVTRFAIDAALFLTDPVEGLDFTIFAVGPRFDGPGALGEFGASPLSDAADKHMLGEFANIVQHPKGRFKEVVLRENRLVNRFDDALHYVADTEPGSSGSPVYNSEWRLIALHHWGGPWIDGRGGAVEINEGIRISSIVRALRDRMPGLSPDIGPRFARALALAEKTTITPRPAPPRPAVEAAARASAPSVGDDGTVTWTIPLEVSVRLPLAATAPASAPRIVNEAEQFRDRDGYDPNFLPGFSIPLPVPGPGPMADVARLKSPPPGALPYELKYRHFSVVMNGRRRLALFTACVIDGATAKSVTRTTRVVTDFNGESLEGAEGDSWAHDPRIRRDAYSGDEIYERQNIPGFPRNTGARQARMFQKGHLVRRLNPAWGDDATALEAEADTFYWTNAAPQVGFFNQGRADPNQPGTGQGKLWRVIEDYILENAAAEDLRVVSFTGPIFRDDDRAYRHIQIPARFFKVTVWVEAGTLKALALIADQAQVIDAWPENLDAAEAAGEAFLDPDQLDRVQDFLSTVADIEALTEIDFGPLVRSADMRAGSGTEPAAPDDAPPVGGGGRRLRGALAEPDGPADDLARIRGIGPALHSLLNANGVFHFRQIAAWTPDDIAVVDGFLKFRGRVVRDDWVGQAKRLTGGA